MQPRFHCWLGLLLCCFMWSARAAAPQEPLIDPREITVLRDRLLFNAFHPQHGQALWALDAASGKTERLTTTVKAGFRGAAPGGFVHYAGRLYFTCDDGTHGAELWVTDGTEQGTRQVADIAPGESASSPSMLTEFQGELYFVADAGSGFQLWKTKGTVASTALVAGAEALANPGQLTVAGNRLFFSARDPSSGNELWAIDAPTASPRLVKDLRPGTEDGRPSMLTAVGATLFFAATDGATGVELWRSDGTREGTVLVRDIRPGLYGSRPTYLTAAAGKLFFAADDGEHGVEPWTSDGTATGTRLVKDIRSGAAGSGVSFTLELDGAVLFAATDGERGLELWRSDGTDQGTRLVKDLAAGVDSGLPHGLTRVRGRVLFSASPGGIEQLPWASDGTADGTRLLVPTEGGIRYRFPSRFTGFGESLAFVARDNFDNERLWLMGADGKVELVGAPLTRRLR